LLWLASFCSSMAQKVKKEKKPKVKELSGRVSADKQHFDRSLADSSARATGLLDGVQSQQKKQAAAIADLRAAVDNQTPRAVTAVLAAFSLPPSKLPLLGRCTVKWNSNSDQYTFNGDSNYAVFAPNGSFSWVAPFKNQRGEEHGQGYVLDAPIRTVNLDGSWEVVRRVSNYLYPPTSTGCCCEYISGPNGNDGAAIGWPITLSDYGVGCSDMQTHGACPKDNATALQLLGAPYSEVYVGCEALEIDYLRELVPSFEEESNLFGVLCSVFVVLLALLLGFFVYAWKKLGKESLVMDENYHGIEGE